MSATIRWRTTSRPDSSTNDRPGMPSRMLRTSSSPERDRPSGRSIWVTSPVTTAFEPNPRRVRNIFICSAVVFWASSRMMNESLSVLWVRRKSSVTYSESGGCDLDADGLGGARRFDAVDEAHRAPATVAPRTSPASASAGKAPGAPGAGSRRCGRHGGGALPGRSPARGTSRRWPGPPCRRRHPVNAPGTPRRRGGGGDVVRVADPATAVRLGDRPAVGVEEALEHGQPDVGAALNRYASGTNFVFDLVPAQAELAERSP